MSMRRPLLALIAGSLALAGCGSRSADAELQSKVAEANNAAMRAEKAQAAAERAAKVANSGSAPMVVEEEPAPDDEVAPDEPTDDEATTPEQVET
ncbi:hypothetical protein ACFO0A_06610 [Novosphingobium tardum]|jgi:hypothetical protein|uniref:Secreted protein n=1 Tax=Novosphingobium tardum TaxID=1538021 RepID=A0ABV8RQ98_9SPHN